METLVNDLLMEELGCQQYQRQQKLQKIYEPIQLGISQGGDFLVNEE